MIVSSASNAALVKARALNAKRLRAQQYEELLACRSVNDIAVYLRTTPGYSCAFVGEGTVSYHRRQLESIVNASRFMRLASLCRFETAIGDGMADYLVTTTDVELLIHAVRNINTLHPGMYSAKIPDYFIGKSRLPAGFSGVVTLNELLEGVKGTEYEEWFKKFENSAQPDYFEIEQMLIRRLNQRGIADIKSGVARKSRDEALELISYTLDIESIVSLYRLKRVGKPSEHKMRQAVHTEDSLLSSAKWSELIAAPGSSEMLRALRNTPYEAFLTDTHVYAEMSARELLYDKCMKTLRFSSNSGAVIISYFNLIENEVKNLNHIIEGIRYSMPVTEIRSFLIGAQ